MKKVILRSLAVLVTVILVVLFAYISYIAPGVTGYSAKQVASGIFVSGRTLESIEKEDISFFPVKFTKNIVDNEKKEVTSRLLMLWKSHAVYNEGLGCTLVKGYSADEVRALDYPDIGIKTPDQDTIAWPAGDIVADSVPEGIDMQRIDRILDAIFEDKVHCKGTFAITVTYRDQLVAERYRGDILPSTKLLGWSVAKSYTNALAGVLAGEGKVDVTKPMNFPGWEGTEKARLTMNNLFRMNSGLEFNEEYSKIMLTDVTTMLTKKGDMAAYAASKKAVAGPDSLWNYSGGSTNIIMKSFRNLFPDNDSYLAFPFKSLFSRTGMLNTIIEPDASGTFVGSSYVYATARDYARFGLLFLHRGNWLGEQIFDAKWVDYSTLPSKGSGGDYGAHFWINSSGEFPGVPADLFYADGHDGQFIFIIPSKDLVVTRNGFSPGSMFDEKTFLKEICDAIN